MLGRTSHRKPAAGPSAQPDRTTPRLEGLLKKRNVRGSWQTRWFVLTGSELRYFVDAKSSTAKGVSLFSLIGFSNRSGIARSKKAVITSRPPPANNPG